jgi:glycosyltransferase involved in cell wall biosynthesis
MQRAGGWRCGCGSGYEIEQTTFALSLWPLVCSSFDIVHVQDPGVALILDRLNRAGVSRPRVILGHGTEESGEMLARLASLQHLAPFYQEQWEERRPSGQHAFAIPNFVDVDVFSPGDRVEARKALGLPEDDLLILSVAAVKIHHKRIDSLLREFAMLREKVGRVKLLLAGGREAETDQVLDLARELGDDVIVRVGVDRSLMPTLYRAADVFALASFHEMMPIAILEAMASGVPVACNDTPVMSWMVGDGGCPTDITQPGALARQIELLCDLDLRRMRGENARRRAISVFSAEAVIPQMLRMYRVVLDVKRDGRTVLSTAR